jgi:hypothetical protein
MLAPCLRCLPIGEENRHCTMARVAGRQRSCASRERAGAAAAWRGTARARRGTSDERLRAAGTLGRPTGATPLFVHATDRTICALANGCGRVCTNDCAASQRAGGREWRRRFSEGGERSRHRGCAGCQNLAAAEHVTATFTGRDPAHRWGLRQGGQAARLGARGRGAHILGHGCGDSSATKRKPARHGSLPRAAPRRHHPHPPC